MLTNWQNSSKKLGLRDSGFAVNTCVTTAWHGGAMAASTAALGGQRTNLNKTRLRQVTPFPENALEPLEACISCNWGEILGDMCGWFESPGAAIFAHATRFGRENAVDAGYPPTPETGCRSTVEWNGAKDLLIIYPSFWVIDHRSCSSFFLSRHTPYCCIACKCTNKLFWPFRSPTKGRFPFLMGIEHVLRRLVLENRCLCP